MDAGEAAKRGPEMSHVLRTGVSPQGLGTEGGCWGCPMEIGMLTFEL